MKHVIMIGSGPMACEYAKVLQALEIPFTVIGNREQSVAEFEQKTGIKAISGGYQEFFARNNTQYSHAIVTVGEKRLGEACRAVIEQGIPTVLVEKPGGIDAQDIRSVAQSAAANKVQVFVGYNRRFYASVEQAKQIIQEDGGLLSFNFEFTEWGHVIANLEKEEGVKEHWFLANSSHVIDLAFYLGGKPKTLNAYTSGSLSWHPNASIYAGAGMTEGNALFSYQANWQAPGRWSLEFLTAKHRLFFKPVEKLHVQKIGSIAVEEFVLDDALDYDFKAGLYKQTQAFITNPGLLPSIEEQVQMLTWYEQINPAK